MKNSLEPVKENKPIEDDDELAKLMPVFGDDLDSMLFYVSWLKNGLNATAAYQELHPECKRSSCEVLGSKALGRISKDLLLKAYGLDVELYLTQLHDGNKAMKRDQFSGEMYPDHKTRKDYHDKLGRLLGWEGEEKKEGTAVIPIINIQINENGVVEKGGKE